MKPGNRQRNANDMGKKSNNVIEWELCPGYCVFMKAELQEFRAMANGRHFETGEP